MQIHAAVQVALATLLVLSTATTSRALTLGALESTVRRRRPCIARRFQLAGSLEDDHDSTPTGRPTRPSVATLAMMGLPLGSAVFPLLLQTARSLPANSAEQLLVVTALFVGNRVYLYAMAATIVALAALRGAHDPVGLGRRVGHLTEELLHRPDATTREKTPQWIQSLRDSGVEESLDDLSAETQALILPLLVALLFAASLLLLPLWYDDSLATTNVVFRQDWWQRCLPLATQLWNAGILTAFSRAELRRLGVEWGIDSTAMVEWGLAAVVVAVACWTLCWPAQNFVNMSLAILVARMIQLDRFPAMVGALGLLTIYDVTSVLWIPAAGAVEPFLATIGGSDLILSAAPGDSAMGSVAIEKLTSGTFQPGLLVTKIDGNNLGGALGLGDAVFPSILATFVRRFDLHKGHRQLSLFGVSIGGYLLGCTACEFAPSISTTGLPALVFILPFMLGSVLVAASVNGELVQLWKYTPKGRM